MTKQRFKRLFWWGLFMAWLILTVYLSSQSGTGSAYLSQDIAKFVWRGLQKVFGSLVSHIEFNTFHIFFRKLTHFAVHFILAILLVRASCWTFPSRKFALFFAWITAIAIASIDEAVQMLAPGRVSALFDAGLNLSGAMIGALISSLFGPKNLKK